MIRVLIGVAAVVLAVVIVWALLVPLADWLARHDVGSATGALHETALDNARGRLLTLGAGLVAGGALVFTALNFNLLRRNSEQADQWQRRTHELTEQGQVTDRFTKAIEQLGSDKLDVRIGGIYALERIARDSAKDHPTVMEVLTAFIREHSHERWPPSDADSPEQERLSRPDVQAAITVVGRRDALRDVLRIDLTGATLGGAALTRANLTRAVLIFATLTDANLTGADLTGADLGGADLNHAILMDANLTGADLSDATLMRADLSRANLDHARLDNARLDNARLGAARLTGANLSAAVLSDAYLAVADLAGADLAGADFSSAILIGADFSSAILIGADFSSADLTGAVWPEDRAVPNEWKLDGRGRLVRAPGPG